MQIGDSTEGRDSFSMRYVDSSTFFFEAIHHYGLQCFTYIYMYICILCNEEYDKVYELDMV